MVLHRQSWAAEPTYYESSRLPRQPRRAVGPAVGPKLSAEHFFREGTKATAG